MTAIPDSDLVGDADLAVAAAAGDRAAFAEIYDRYADRLYDFCVGMVRDRNTAADCVQDTFCTAATRLGSLRDPGKLRPWLYAIARNEALRCIRERRREQPSDELPEATSSDPSPDTLAVRSELAELVAQAAGGLSDRDRTVLELTYRHGMDGPELAEALGVSAASARTLTHRLRETVERSLGALLVVRNARTGLGCPELAASMKDWDGQFTVLTRKRVARHIDSCPVCEASRRKMVNPRALLGGAPLFIAAPPGLRKRTLDRIQLVCAQSALTGPFSAEAGAGRADNSGQADAPRSAGAGSATAAAALAYPPDDVGARDGDAPDNAAGDDERRKRRGLLLLFLLLAVALFAALWVTLAWPFVNDAPTAPAGVTETSSRPIPTPAATTATQAPPSTPPPSPVVVSTAPASPPPVYRKPDPPQFVPPAPDPGDSAPPASPEPTIPMIRPTPPRTTAPLFPAPRATSPGPSGNTHSKGPGSTGTGSTGTGSTGTGSTGTGSTGTGSPGTGSTGTGSTGTGSTGTGSTGGTSDPSGGPVR